MKKRYTSEEKTMILREYLENQVSISDLAEQYNLHPNAIYKWKKQKLDRKSWTKPLLKEVIIGKLMLKLVNLFFIINIFYTFVGFLLRQYSF